MADVTREYATRYTSDVSNAISGIDTLIARLQSLDVLCDTLNPKLNNLTKAMPAALAKASEAADRLVTSLTSVSVRASVAGQELEHTGRASTEAAKGVAATARAANKAADNLTATATAAQAAATQLGAVQTAATGAAASLNQVKARSASAQTSLSGFIRIGTILHVARQALEGMAEALEKAREYARETAEKVIGIKDALRELATLRGEKGVTNKLVGDQLELMVRTGASVNETREFDEIWQSSIEAMQKSGHWKLNDQETKEFKVEALRMAVRTGLNPKTLANNLGSMGVAEDVTSVDQGLAKLSAQQKMAVLGMGNLTPIYQAIQKRAGNLVNPKGMGATKSREELAGLIAVATYTSGTPDRAATAVNAAWRDMNKSGSDKLDATNRRFGIQASDDYLTRIRKLKPLLDQAERPGGAGAVRTFGESGFGNEVGRSRVIQDIRDLDKHEEFQNELGATMRAGGGAVRADNAAFRANNQARFAAAKEEAAEQVAGMREEPLEIARKASRARLKAQGWVPGTTNNEILGGMVESVPGGKGLMRMMEGESRTDQVVDAEVRRKILEVDPKALEKHPDLVDHGLTGAARGAELAEIVRSYPAEMQAKFNETPGVEGQINALQNGVAVPPNAPGPVAAGRRPGANAAAKPKAAAPAPVAGAPAGGNASAMNGGEAVAKLGEIVAILREQQGPLSPLQDGFGGYRA